MQDYDEDMEAKLVAWLYPERELISSSSVVTRSLDTQVPIYSVYGRLKWGEKLEEAVVWLLYLAYSYSLLGTLTIPGAGRAKFEGLSSGVGSIIQYSLVLYSRVYNIELTMRMGFPFSSHFMAFTVDCSWV